MTVEDIARTCHEANRSYCMALGDHTQMSWQYAPTWQRRSAANGVQNLIDHPNAGPADSHNNWLEEKRREGWKYGTLKDPDKKEHPCFVPYEDLPVEQKVKDALFTSIAKLLIPMLETAVPSAT